jgi:hypothetical protein
VFVDVLNARGYRISPVMKPISITMPLRLSSRPAATTDRSGRSSLVGPWAGRRAGVEVVGGLVAVSMIKPFHRFTSMVLSRPWDAAAGWPASSRTVAWSARSWLAT